MPGSAVALDAAAPDRGAGARLLTALPLAALLLAALLAAAGCGGARPPAAPIAGVTVGAPCVAGRCAEGLSCHHGPPGASAAGRCQLEVGRCRSDWDCARGGAQRTGFVFRKRLGARVLPDLEALALQDLRAGSDLALQVAGRELRLLSVHLKAFCVTGSLARAVLAGAGCSFLDRTKILPSCCSTVQHASGANAGARTASPVRRLKQAWCQGQRTVSSTISPSASGPP